MPIASVDVTVTDNDMAAVPGLDVSESALTVGEGSSGSYTVALASQPTADVVVVVDGHSGGGDVTVNASSSAVELTFSSSTWDMAQSVTVAAVDDSAAEGEETVTLTHTVKVADSAVEYAAVGVVSLTVTVTDNDMAGLDVSESALTVGEGESEDYTVALASQPAGDVVVTVDGHSGGGGDVTVNGETGAVELTFSSSTWDMAQSVTVAAVDDSAAEGEETVTLTHAVSSDDDAVYGALAVVSLTVTVTDNDTAGLDVSESALTVGEGESEDYTVALASQPTADVVVVVDGHSGGGDVTVNSSSSAVELTFSSSTWDMAQTVTVAAVDDSAAEGEETVTLTHTVKVADSAVEYAAVGVVSLTVTVTDNDTAGLDVSESALTVGEGESEDYTVALASQPAGDVVVTVDGHSGGGGDVTVNGETGAVELTFSSSTWDMAQTVTVAAVDDSAAEGDETVTLTHGVASDDDAVYGALADVSLTVTVTDNDTAGLDVSESALTVGEGESEDYTVALASQPAGDVVVTVDGHSGGGGDVTVNGETGAVELTFTSSTWDMAQTVTVAAVDDSAAEGNETVTLTHAVSSDDDAVYGALADVSLTVTVTDNDMAAVPGLDVSESALTVGEGSSGQYTVALASQPTADVVVVVDGHSGGGDVRVNASSSAVELTFTSSTWNTAQTVTVAAVDDSAAEGSETVTLTHTVKVADSAVEYAAVGVVSLTVTVTDNDMAGLDVSESALTVGEGSSGQYTVALASQPTADVVVTVDGHSGGGDVTVNGETGAVELTFTSSTWNMAQTVTVAAVDDSAAEGNETVTLTHTVKVADSAVEYAAVADATVTVTVVDNDMASLNSVAAGEPTISGTAQVNETLTASVSGITDADGLSGVQFNYQWIRTSSGTDTDIPNATNQTYQMAPADEGATIKVRVSFTDQAGHSESLISAPTVAVRAADDPGLAVTDVEVTKGGGPTRPQWSLRRTATCRPVCGWHGTLQWPRSTMWWATGWSGAPTTATPTLLGWTG